MLPGKGKTPGLDAMLQNAMLDRAGLTRNIQQYHGVSMDGFNEACISRAS